MTDIRVPLPDARHDYLYAGLHIRSNIAFPELDPFPGAAGGDVPAVHIAAVERLTVEIPAEGSISPGEYRFHIDAVGDYRVTDGKSIQVAPMPGAGMAEVRLFVLGTAWAALAYQRDLLFLHASAVRFGDRAVAFCGASGAGKSTTCALATADGGEFVGDDLCRFEVSPGQRSAVVYPSSRRMKLWRDSVEQLAMTEAGLQRDHFRTDKFHLPATARGDGTPVALGAICLLAWGDERIVRLTGRTAVKRLLEAATYRAYLIEPMNIMARHWQRCLELAGVVPVIEFTRPKEWGRSREATARLIDLLKGIHLESL